MKTIEEAAEEYSKLKSSAEIFTCAHKIDFKVGVEFAQRWISVEDELPEVDIEVIVKTLNLKYSIAKMYTPKDCNGTILGEKEWKCSRTFKSSITHWRQIELK